MIAVAQNSTLDRYSNNFSLFLLLEQFRPSAYPARLAVFCHAFFEIDDEEKGVEHEMRVVVERDGVEVSSSDPVVFRPSGERHRVRTHGLAIPEAGLFRVTVRWRRREADGEGEWNTDTAAWPIRAEAPMH
jgi:hypothetical protein